MIMGFTLGSHVVPFLFSAGGFEDGKLRPVLISKSWSWVPTLAKYDPVLK